MKITLESGQFGWDYLIRAEDGQDVLVQTDCDYPGVAQTFGWTPPKREDDPSTLIGLAQAWLDEHIGATADDPGYFD
jgi:hypothetical protein